MFYNNVHFSFYFFLSLFTIFLPGVLQPVRLYHIFSSELHLVGTFIIFSKVFYFVTKKYKKNDKKMAKIRFSQI